MKSVALSVLCLTTMALATSCVAELCPGGVFPSGLLVLGEGIWVGAGRAPPWMVDADGGSLVRIGTVGSSPISACSVLEGGIELGGSMPTMTREERETLPAFAEMTDIGGSIVWLNNHPSDELNAFNSLTTLAGGVGIPIGADVQGFNRLEEISFLDGPTRISGFQSLERITGDASLHNSIDGLSLLSEVGGNLELQGGLAPESLASLETVGGLLKFSNSRTIGAMNFPELNRVGGDFVLDGTALSDLSPTTKLAFVGGAIIIINNDGIPSEHALEWAFSVAEVAGNSERADEFGSVYVCRNLTGTIGNCPEEQD